MKYSQLRSVILGLVVVALLTGSFLAGRTFADRRVARAQSEGAPAAPADPSFSSFYCSNVNNVASFDNRIHLRCATTNNVGGDLVRFYAYPTSGSSSSTANRMLAVGQIAYALDRGVWIYYQASTSYNPPSCNSGDCRLLVGISMLE
jgi:hypothetical protein